MKRISSFTSTFAAMALTTACLSVFFASSAFARQIPVRGTGYESGHCSGDQGYFCISSIKDRAERSGIQQAEWSCTTQQGRSLRYTAYCSSYCSPNSLPPGTSAWVRCDANCSMQCEVN